MRNGMVLGTPACMAPEQVAGREVDLRADLWAVGALVYRMLTGRFPFGSGSLAEVGAAIIDDDPDPPTEHAPDLPPAIDSWMERALAKDAEQRFESAGELASTLVEALGEPEPLSYPALVKHGSGVRRVRRRPHIALVATTMAALAGLIVVVLFLFRR